MSPIAKYSLIVAFLLSPLALLAQPSTRDRRSDRRPPFPERAERRFADDAADWNEAQTFFKEHSPKRWKEWESLDNPNLKDRLKNAMLMRWRGMQWAIREGNDDIRQSKEKQFAIEDEIFGLRMAARRGDMRPQEARQQMRAKLKTLVEERLKERQLRINRLKEILAEEEQDLQEDKGRVDALVEGELTRPGHLDEELGPRRRGPPGRPLR